MCLFSDVGCGIFRISFKYCLSQFSHVSILLLFIARMSKQEISRVYSAFRHFHQNKTLSTFFRFLCSASLTESCQKMARNVMLSKRFCAIVGTTFEFGALLHYGVL